MTKHQIFQKGSTTFFYSSLFFPKNIKDEVATVYAYVRIIDDLVDQPNPDQERLSELWQQTKLAWQGRVVSDQVVHDFVMLAQRRKFAWKWIDAFWWAMRQDLVKKKYRSFAEVEKYMYGSAEVIGLMMVRLLGLPKAAEPAAQLQGKAMQLINFIRDVKEDAELGRSYLAFEGGDNLHQKKTWQEVVEKQLQRYYLIQAAAENGYRYLPYRYQVPIVTAAQLYLWTAEQIKKNPALVWQGKLKPSKFRILATALKNTVRLWV